MTDAPCSCSVIGFGIRTVKQTPAKFSLLSARKIQASGGNTQFADMRAAWDALAPEIQAECMGWI